MLVLLQRDVEQAAAPLALLHARLPVEVLLRVACHLRGRPAGDEVARDAAPVPLHGCGHLLSGSPARRPHQLTDVAHPAQGSQTSQEAPVLLLAPRLACVPGCPASVSAALQCPGVSTGPPFLRSAALRRPDPSGGSGEPAGMIAGPACPWTAPGSGWRSMETFVLYTRGDPLYLLPALQALQAAFWRVLDSSNQSPGRPGRDDCLLTGTQACLAL